MWNTIKSFWKICEHSCKNPFTSDFPMFLDYQEDCAVFHTLSKITEFIYKKNSFDCE